MAKPIKIDLIQILVRKIKGYAFMSYPDKQGFQCANDYRQHQKKLLEDDFKSMPEVEFRNKYQHYIY